MNKRFAAIIALGCLVMAAPGVAQMGPNYGSIAGREESEKMKMKRCYDRQRAPEDRARACKAVMAIGNSFADEVDVAQAYLEAGKFDDALAALVPRMQSNSSDADALTMRAVILAAQGHYDLALVDSNRVIKVASQDASSYYGRCWMRAVAGQELDAAVADCDKAIAQDPNNGAIWDSRGLADFKRGDMKAAIADCGKAIDSRWVSADTYAYLVRFVGGDAAKDMASQKANSYYVRGLAKRLSGDADGAAKDIERANSRDPYIAAELSHIGVVDKQLVAGQ
ncbi:MAG TPA: tetratricopeptide repeat protein [Rhizomicrobium sp.]|jgi:tetratricopeptide (TPR) repeat protein